MPAKKRTVRKRRTKAKQPATHSSGLWRIALIVYAIIGFRMLEFMDIRVFEFVRRLPDAWGVSDYNLNFLLLGVSLAGLVILLCSKASKSLLNLAGGAMLLIPVWFRCEDFAGAIGARALSFNGLEPMALAFVLGASLICVCIVHGADFRLQLCVGLIAAAEYAGMCFMDNFPTDWSQLVFANAFAISAGFAMDLAYNGFNISSLLPVVSLAAELMMWYADVGTATRSTVTLGLCAADLLALALVPKLRKNSAGIAVSIGVVAAGAAFILYESNISII